MGTGKMKVKIEIGSGVNCFVDVRRAHKSRILGRQQYVIYYY